MPATSPSIVTLDVSTIRLAWSSEVAVSNAGHPMTKKPDTYGEHYCCLAHGMSFVEWDDTVQHCLRYHGGGWV